MTSKKLLRIFFTAASVVCAIAVVFNDKQQKALSTCAKNYTNIMIHDAGVEPVGLNCKGLFCDFTVYIQNYPAYYTAYYEKNDDFGIVYKGLSSTFLGETTFYTGDSSVIRCDIYKNVEGSDSDVK